jgi:DNA-binding phage protein
MEEILKFDKSIIALQKKKLGLLRPPRYDTTLGPEAYYKEKVMELYVQHGELTYTLLQEKLPGAYDYLGDNHTDWFRVYIVNQRDTLPYRQRREEMLVKVSAAVEQIAKEEAKPKRQISYSYIAETAGVTRDELRSDKNIRIYLAGIIETKESWYQRRITYAYHNLSVESRNQSASQICRKALIGEETFKKYRELFEEVVNELKASTTK